MLVYPIFFVIQQLSKSRASNQLELSKMVYPVITEEVRPKVSRIFGGKRNNLTNPLQNKATQTAQVLTCQPPHIYPLI